MLKGAAAMDQRWILHSSIGAAVAVMLRCGRTALAAVAVVLRCGRTAHLP